MQRLGLALAVLSLALPAAHAQDPRQELRGLGESARLRYPALAELVDEARALARERDLDAGRIYRSRYGAFGASAGAARRDRQALAEALEALWVIERAAARRGAPTEMTRGLHQQLLATINRGYEATGRDLEATRNQVPTLDPTWLAGRSYRELFADMPRTRVATYGVTRPAVLFLVALAESARATPDAAGALDDARFAQTLALAGEATRYRLEGTALGTGRRYGGWALLEEEAGQLLLTLQPAGEPPRRAPLQAADEGAWRLVTDVQQGPGLAGRLSGDEGRALRLEADYRRTAPGRIEGGWRLLDGDRLVERGEETLVLDAPEAAPADEVEPLLAQSPLFAEIVAACRRVVDRGTVPADLLVTTANRVDARVLLEGPAIFAAQGEMIASAEREVLFQALTFDPASEPGQRILGALRQLEARRAATPELPPVRVRIVINSHWGRDFGTDGTRRAIQALELDPRRVEVQVVPHGHTLFGALHSKTLVVDGRRGIVTGANPEAVHDEQALPWFDAAFGVEGRVAEALRADFNHLWHKVTDAWLPPLDLPAATTTATGEPLEARTPVLVATRKADGGLFSNSVDDPQGQAFVTAITRAQRRVRIHTPNLNDDAICAAILDAVLENGVTVQVVLPYGFNETGAKLTGGTNASTVARLQRQVRERGGEAAAARLQLRWYAKKDGSGRSEGNEQGAAHTKYASFDGQVAIVGSGNLDTQAINHSRELNLVVDDAQLVRAWDAQHFAPSWARAVPAEAPAPAIDEPLGE